MENIKENTIWQTVYEQLQEILNKCIELWYDYMWIDMRRDDRDRCLKFQVRSDWLFLINNEDGILRNISYHELFSKDSGIMEFVEWREIYPTVANLQAHYVNMCVKTAEQKIKYFIANAKVPWN